MIRVDGSVRCVYVRLFGSWVWVFVACGEFCRERSCVVGCMVRFVGCVRECVDGCADGCVNV